MSKRQSGKQHLDAKQKKDKTGDHPPPKRAMTPWLIFHGVKTQELAAEGKRKEAHELAKKAWDKMNEKEKAPYVKKAEADEKRYQKQAEELKAKGYYKLEDGTKSTDP